LEDAPKRDTSTTVEGDLLSMDDDEIRYSPGLAAHPALDPYEGMPWSSNLAQNGQDRDVRPLTILVLSADGVGDQTKPIYRCWGL
jgi:hypothetical protein